jgi:hypothetical protein
MNYYYLYLIKFEDGQFYIGSRKSKVKPENDTKYWGSPRTFKHLWEDVSLPKTKHILKVCDSFDEMRKLEPKLIKDAWEKFPEFCLNRCASPIFHPDVCEKGGKKGGKKVYESKKGIFALTPEQKSEAGKKGGTKASRIHKEFGLGLYSLTKEQRIENAKIGGQRVKELGMGIHSLTKEQRSIHGKKCGEKAKELGLGIFALTPEQKSEHARKLGKKAKELGTGIHSLTKEQRIQNGKKGGRIRAEKTAKEFELLSPNGKIVKGKNIAQFCKENNLNNGHITSVIKGRLNQHKGWTKP